MRKTGIAECLRFVEEKTALYQAINSAGDGNLIRPLSFFRWGSHFYLATELVPQEEIDPLQLPFRERLLLCLTVAHSVMGLHQAGVVHSDIKPENVLLHRTGLGTVVGKLVDFDCSFFASTPPQNLSELGGDLVYLSPEACKFSVGEEASLTGAMDVFALALLFHKYLTGSLPAYDRDAFDYVNEVVLDEGELTLSPDLPEQVRDLLRSMLVCDEHERIDSASVVKALQDMVCLNRGQKPPSHTGFYVPGDL